MSIKRKTTVKNLSAYKKKKINTECPYFQGTSRSKTLYFISVSWSFIYREASESVSLLHEVSLFNFWLNGYTYESLLDKGQSSQLCLTPIGLPGKISQWFMPLDIQWPFTEELYLEYWRKVFVYRFIFRSEYLMFIVVKID